MGQFNALLDNGGGALGSGCVVDTVGGVVGLVEGSVYGNVARASPQSDRSMPPSTGSITPVTKDDAGLSRKAAAAANSSGRP